MMRHFISLGSLNAALAVILGAFGAHALKSKIQPEALEIFQTGVQYHLYHSLGLILIGIIYRVGKLSTAINFSGWMMVIGMILFSGSLYILSITGIRSIGMITPIGGILLVISWILLAIAWLKQ
jgi:uncharacterized membrane protein YgdD (TMEM256/DUF423 family)